MAAIQPQVATQGFNLIITDRAAEEVRKFMERGAGAGRERRPQGQRAPGGCSGFKYSLNIEERALEDDAVVEVSGVRVFVDGFSMQYLSGITIDYTSSMQGSGFTFNNPNASGGCGCGSSFTA